jgi:hypothetical protein
MLKKRDFNYPVSHLTLGTDIFNELRLSLKDNSVFSFSNWKNYEAKEGLGNKFEGYSLGYPIKISYRRKNLIQVNLKKPRRRWVLKYNTDIDNYISDSKLKMVYSVFDIHNSNINDEADALKLTCHTLKHRCLEKIT